MELRENRYFMRQRCASYRVLTSYNMAIIFDILEVLLSLKARELSLKT